MHELIRDEAKHNVIADSMKYVDHEVYELERLDANRALEAKRKKS